MSVFFTTANCRAALGEGSTKLGDVGHRETAVLGEQQGVGSIDPRLELGDPFDLLGLGHRASLRNMNKRASADGGDARDATSSVASAGTRLGLRALAPLLSAAEEG